MKKLIFKTIFITLLFNSSLFAQSNGKLDKLQKEINKITKDYEKRISKLEGDIKKSSKKQPSSRNIYSNKLNPSIGIILNGKYAGFSTSEAEISSFQVGEEGKRGKEGFSIGESELNFAANVDDKFYASLTAAIVNEDGSDIIELEEAYVQTLSNKFLLNGLSAKFGRAFWNLGYLNSHHAHSDDFADRPLPYRIYLNKAFNDDGVEFSYLLPIDFYVELGGGVFRGDDFPFANGGDKTSYSAFIKFAGDIGNKQSWQLGASMLSGQARAGEGNGRVTGEDPASQVSFIGDTNLYVADFRYIFAPTANNRNQELILQGEYFYRAEDGNYTIGSGTPAAFDDATQGYYTQAIYKFTSQWRIGARYSKMNAAINTAIAADGFDPESRTVMVDWTNSEFSRVRFQYNREELSKDNNDNQFILQYIVSIGAHGAHKY